ncbi:MAG TPA: response regulator [Nitrososphaeraceae archaeon]|nr:response regulator [Nitrososphaeraceae archaeon]
MYKNKKIMIIDDDRDINDLFKLFLEYDGYKVNAFTDPIDALYSFRKYEYDLILLDLKMPNMDGMMLYHRLRRIDNNVLIYFITANNEYIQRLKIHIPDIEKIVIYKPILLSELRKKINSIILVKEKADDDNNKLLQYI